MRDNHHGMTELLTAYERDGQWFGAIEVTLGSESRQFEFGVQQAGYLAFKRILDSRPFDDLPGLKRRYFVTGRASRVPEEDHCKIGIRIEQERSSKSFDFDVPISLGSNLLWFKQLVDFSDAAHLRSPQASIEIA
jgi:hypothetical protein